MFSDRSFKAVLLALAFGLMAAAPAANAEPGVLDLSGYQGKVVYVDFWASWCVPCRRSFPWMQAMQREYGPQGFVVITVNVDEHREEAETFLARYGGEVKVQYDDQGRLARQFGVVGMPSSVLIDRRGSNRFHHTGFRERDPPEIEAQIRQLVNER